MDKAYTKIKLELSRLWRELNALRASDLRSDEAFNKACEIDNYLKKHGVKSDDFMLELSMNNIDNRIGYEFLNYLNSKFGRKANCAKMLGVCKETVNAWIRGRSGIAKHHHKKIKDWCGIDPCEQ